MRKPRTALLLAALALALLGVPSRALSPLDECDLRPQPPQCLLPTLPPNESDPAEVVCLPVPFRVPICWLPGLAVPAGGVAPAPVECPWPWGNVPGGICSPFPPEKIPGPPFGPFPPPFEPEPPRCELICDWCPPGRYCPTVCRIECRQTEPPCLIPEGCPFPWEPHPWLR